MSQVLRLTPDHEASLHTLLDQERIVNLFLIGFLSGNPVDRFWWYGVVDGDHVRAAALVIPGRLTVPYAPERQHGEMLGAQLRRSHRPTMMVGPREACDMVWQSWARTTPYDRFYDQRLYVARAPVSADPVSGFRRAREEEWSTIALNAALMEEEDLGRNPYQLNPKLHEQAVRDRIRAGRTLVIEQNGAIVFQINVGTVTPFGAQVGGTYVPPPHRGAGLGRLGMQELVRHLLRTYPLVTLHVNEENLPAVRSYEGSGFYRETPFRLITLPS